MNIPFESSLSSSAASAAAGLRDDEHRRNATDVGECYPRASPRKLNSNGNRIAPLMTMASTTTRTTKRRSYIATKKKRSSMTKSKHERSSRSSAAEVKFHPLVEVLLVEMHHEYTDEEHYDSWYGQDELDDVVMAENIEIARILRQARYGDGGGSSDSSGSQNRDSGSDLSSNNNESSSSSLDYYAQASGCATVAATKHLCDRGLEAIVDPTMLAERKGTQAAVVRAVLEEQDDRRRRRREEEERLLVQRRRRGQQEQSLQQEGSSRRGSRSRSRSRLLVVHRRRLRDTMALSNASLCTQHRQQHHHDNDSCIDEEIEEEVKINYCAYRDYRHKQKELAKDEDADEDEDHEEDEDEDEEEERDEYDSDSEAYRRAMLRYSVHSAKLALEYAERDEQYVLDQRRKDERRWRRKCRCRIDAILRSFDSDDKALANTNYGTTAAADVGARVSMEKAATDERKPRSTSNTWWDRRNVVMSH